MEVIKGLEAIEKRHRGAVVTIGNFDGLHRGHQKIIRAVLDEAKRLGAKSMAITFEPHPVKVLQPERGLRIITPAKEKARLMELYGVGSLLLINFTRDFAKTSADEFIKDVLVGRLGVRLVIVGHNYAFGKGKKGTTSVLRRQGRKYGFGVKVVRYAMVHGDVVSSSRIRSLVHWGRLCEAALYLGRPYMIEGTVIRGAGRGARLLGTPTANLSTANELIPKEGVYAVRAELEGGLHDGVANIGRNPTFTGQSSGSEMNIEVHIIGWSGDITGRPLMVHFIDRIRDERAFSGAEALRRQIDSDILKAKDILKGAQPLPLRI